MGHHLPRIRQGFEDAQNLTAPLGVVQAVDPQSTGGRQALDLAGIGGRGPRSQGRPAHGLGPAIGEGLGDLEAGQAGSGLAGGNGMHPGSDEGRFNQGQQQGMG